MVLPIISPRCRIQSDNNQINPENYPQWIQQFYHSNYQDVKLIDWIELKTFRIRLEQAPTAGWRGPDGAQPVPGAGHRGAADQLHLHRAEQPRPGQGHAAALRWGHIQILSVIILLSFSWPELPSPPVISSAELSASQSSYELVWSTESVPAIDQYTVLYRRLPVSRYCR